MKPLRLLRHQAHPLRLAGSIIEARLSDVKVGEICEIRQHWLDKDRVAKAQVLGFNRDRALLSLIGNARGLSREAVLTPTGAGLLVTLNDSLLGTVLDPSGQVVERFVDQAEGAENDAIRPIDATPPSYLDRESIQQPFITGIKAIDGLLTCGIGQRMGIFAAAGCGKTSLMHMLIEQADADVFVIGLIGERGREVTEFTQALAKSGRQHQCVVIYATSDFSSLDRCNAALLATTVAEYFRDQGKKVVLFLDSITRYARALRDVALAAGEAPARRGYPASVFDALPAVLERPGNTKNGSITAFYTILLESDDEPDPIADEIRSILDGHIYLSRKLAVQNHYPAIDVLRSVSRVSGQVSSQKHLSLAAEFRRLLAKIEELQMLLDLGEYTPGENADNDRAINKRDALLQWLQQTMHEHSSIDTTLQAMNALAK
ncbi:type III secretion system ATPase SctN [Candidatus Fukatsuia symbiotica]|uniref:Type 3 secretion system ATPase n=1 Tax=Candidatus Fukatsuia symbiotica TaxID=1878942 RepID=A0A2U8I5A0_9GAMM|nr:type III secretion system ATPase SctN [Candidatus Fukatsuia symbiotica]AWK14309.1 EscN/YscN/HrcN family type III secretion system ATPase [Candidatus Fukatsuia symbiotica]MEA9444565.1 type III secretion system ATPase SctN [Candidatus Fukatsuia symbiotica]